MSVLLKTHSKYTHHIWQNKYSVVRYLLTEKDNTAIFGIFIIVLVKHKLFYKRMA